MGHSLQFSVVQEPIYVNVQHGPIQLEAEQPVQPMPPSPIQCLLEEVVSDPGEGARAPPPSPVVPVEEQPEELEARLEAVVAVLGDRGARSRRSTRSQPGELVAGLESDRRPTRKSLVSCYIP